MEFVFSIAFGVVVIAALVYGAYAFYQLHDGPWKGELPEDISALLERELMRSWAEQFDEWTVNSYEARSGRFAVWLANRPYADMCIENVRIRGRARRQRLREALGRILATHAIQQFPRSTGETLNLERWYRMPERKK